MTQGRPTFVVNPQAPGADLMAHTAAALAAASSALSRAADAPGLATLAAAALDTARDLYVLAIANEGIYSNAFPPNSRACYSHCFCSCLASIIVLDLSEHPHKLYIKQGTA